MEEQDFEMAEKMAEQERESSLAAVRNSLAPEYHEDFDPVTAICIDCNNHVGSHRLENGRIRCYDCQTIREKKMARGIPVEPNQIRPRERPVIPELLAQVFVVENTATPEMPNTKTIDTMNSNEIMNSKNKSVSKDVDITSNIANDTGSTKSKKKSTTKTLKD